VTPSPPVNHLPRVWNHHAPARGGGGTGVEGGWGACRGGATRRGRHSPQKSPHGSARKRAPAGGARVTPPGDAAGPPAGEHELPHAAVQREREHAVPQGEHKHLARGDENKSVRKGRDVKKARRRADGGAGVEASPPLPLLTPSPPPLPPWRCCRGSTRPPPARCRPCGRWWCTLPGPARTACTAWERADRGQAAGLEPRFAGT
jgi:hypothetical protein